MAEATGRELGQISLEEALAPTALVAEKDSERRSRFCRSLGLAGCSAAWSVRRDD